ncbi:LysR family transcriptional regulator [Chelatococcus reniformis]|uniref:LysR family transcriptional regulator n=1 Tax=Chelatococcus reniformis TaxID=1494448 RepID=A0A916XJE1_9HYPH|nr:LysR family transcriptional regulator [Chelatococcus reniformis]GGC75676.1 LysR family transcriptional regulator [Chelatococcus reniformis]
MDRLDAMRLFTRVVDRRSFTQAAHDLDIPRSTATEVIRRLEARLGVRLLQRTTRTVRPTLDGEAYYRRCLAILDDVEDAEGAFRGAAPKGLLRVEVQGTLARHFLMPGLPDFLAHHPAIEIAMSESERWVDVVREGVDCVLRWGTLPDSDLVARPVALLPRITCAAPAYVERYGAPRTIAELAGHRTVGLRSITTGAVRPLEFQAANGSKRVVAVATPLSVTGTETFLSGIRLGLGLAQMPTFHVAQDLASGRLLRLLPDHPVPPGPVSVLYPRNRQLSPRVRLFIDWVVQRFAAASGGGTAIAPPEV